MFMSFDTRKSGSGNILKTLNSITKLLLICCFAQVASAKNIDDSKELIPTNWKSNIVMVPSIVGTLTVVSHMPTPGDMTGRTDVVLRYTIKNDGMDILNTVQIPLDLANQLGADFVGLTGSLSAMTGSGSIFTGSGSMVFGGMLNGSYDGDTDINIFSPTPSLNPDECIAIDIPIRLEANSTGFDLELSARATANSPSGPIETEASKLIVSSGCQDESLACAGRVHVSLGGDCTGVVRLATVFLNADKNPLRYRVVVYENGIAIGDTVNDSHVGKELIFRVLDACFNNRSSCWGTVIVENKNLPELTTTYQEYVCGEDFDDLKSIEDVKKDIDAACSAKVTDLITNYSTTGDKCIGFITERVISGRVDLGAEGIKKVILRRDTIHELPIDTSDINAPIGGPLVTDAIKIACEKAPDGNPTPEFIAAYYDAMPAYTGSGTAYGYPYIDRGFKVTHSTSQKDTIIEKIVPTNILIDSVWVLLNVVVKDTQEIDVITWDTSRYLVPITKGTTCNLSTKCSDIEFESCAGPKTKIKRTWTILDWCTGKLLTFDQWIIKVDEHGPAIEPLDNLEANLLPWTCTAEVQLSAEAIDACSGVDYDQWLSSAGKIDSNGVLSNISLSDSPITITYTAYDLCGNDSTVTFFVNVMDRVRPVAIATDELNTSMVYDPIEQRGIAKVTVDAIDAGSHDSDCGEITRCILLDEELQNPLYFRNGTLATDSDGNQLYEAAQCKYDGIFIDTLSENKGTYETVEILYVICKDFVKFCCEDIGSNRVALIVSDKSPYSDDGISWSDVIVEDKSTTSIVCESLVVNCGDDTSPESLGAPNVIYGICGGGDLTHVDIEDIDGCGEGRIIRQWFIDGELKCEQTINIRGAGVFDPQAIKWPRHYNDGIVSGYRRECVGDSIVYEAEDVIRMGDSFTCTGDALDKPVWCKSSCSLLAVSHSDLELEADGACRKIVRKWTIIDWCNYRPNGSNPDEDNESFVAINDEWLMGDYPSNLMQGDTCVVCEKASGDVGDIYFRYGDDVDVDGYYNFEQIIKIIDDTAPEIDAPSFVSVEITTGASSKNDDYDDCVGNKNITAEAVELCGDIIVDPSTLTWIIEVFNEEGSVLSTKTATGATATMNTQSGNIENRHLIKWYVNDGCGNEGYAETLVRFEDKKSPTPICIKDISTATMNVDGGGVVIWAADFDLGSYDNCGPVKVYFKDEEGFSVKSLSFSCEDIPNGVSTTKELKMYVGDDNGNEDFCFVTLSIEDANKVCANDTTLEAAAISGFVMTYKGDMVEDARVVLNVGAENYTDENGAYAFRNNELYSSYKMISQKNDDPLNGVTTLDIVMIQRHILALKRFDDSHQIIAGDVNGDGRISSIDLVQLRGLILGRFESFPTNESWRFLNPEQNWTNPLVPFPFNEEVVIEELTGVSSSQNFIAVKIGDVSGNAAANSLIAGGRSASRLGLLTSDVYVNSGETISLPVRVGKSVDLVGYQMTIEAKNAIIEKIFSSQKMLGDSDYSLVDKNTATVTWYSTDAITTDDQLFTITITAKKAGYVSEFLSVTNTITPALAYNESLEEMDLTLNFDGNTSNINEAGFTLLQNTPNPFADRTVIGFNLPTSGDVILTVSDITGKIVTQISAMYPQGYNEMSLDKKEFSTAGLYYYELKSGIHAATRKLILID